ncbi:hypothetical protein NLU13_3079 [Sarocladium strictum]|uniref:Uncharacterized protein n=1 Tax=Sarocladium strictum TaxID=5046 RepID=A0AA39GM58_SARSR|nr:hypothetical protein NLU13_3079 [Sarocladium strictum]
MTLQTKDQVTAQVPTQPPGHDKYDPALKYADTRPPPFDLATNGTSSTYHMKLGPRGEAQGAARNFPQPETIWLGRDVDHDDWDTFLTQLDAAASATQTGQNADEQRAAAVVDVDAQDRQEAFNQLEAAQAGGAAAADDQQANAQGQGGTTTTTTSRRGYGIKLGENTLLGLSLPPYSNGFGIRIGGGLLGVSTGEAEDAGNKTQ